MSMFRSATGVLPRAAPSTEARRRGNLVSVLVVATLPLVFLLFAWAIAFDRDEHRALLDHLQGVARAASIGIDTGLTAGGAAPAPSMVPDHWERGPGSGGSKDLILSVQRDLQNVWTVDFRDSYAVPLRADAPTYTVWRDLGRKGWRVGAGVEAEPFDADLRLGLLLRLACAVACVIAGALFAWRLAKRAGMLEAEVDSMPGAVSEAPQSEMLELLSHELRNPLNSIVAGIEVLRRADAGSQLAASTRIILARQTRRLSQLANGLVDAGQVVGRRLALDARPIELSRLLRIALAGTCVRAAERNQKLAVGELREKWVAGHPRRTEQLLQYLVETAMSNTPEGESIEISLGGGTGKAVLRLELGADVIQNDWLSRLLDSSDIQPDASDKPAGLALILLKRLVELHDGTIGIRIDEGDAALIELVLPTIEPHR